MKPEDVVTYIEGEPIIEMAPVEPRLTNAKKKAGTGQRIVGLNTENAEINEGLIRFDIILLGITNELPEHDEKYELHRLIGALLSTELKVSEKLQIIEKEYKIPLDDDIRKEVSIMCNLSQGIEDKAVAKIVMNMHKIGYTPDQIADAVGMSVENVKMIIKKKEPAMA